MGSHRAFLTHAGKEERGVSLWHPMPRRHCRHLDWLPAMTSSLASLASSLAPPAASVTVLPQVSPPFLVHNLLVAPGLTQSKRQTLRQGSKTFLVSSSFPPPSSCFCLCSSTPPTAASLPLLRPVRCGPYLGLLYLTFSLPGIPFLQTETWRPCLILL